MARGSRPRHHRLASFLRRTRLNDSTSSNDANEKHPPKRGTEHADHPEWGFRREAVVWLGDVPTGANMVAMSGEMCAWLQRKVHALTFFTKESEKLACQVKNPYTHSLGTIALTVAGIVNDSWKFSEADEPMDPVDAEITRVRLESELSINVARFCEAAIKQLLYCTSFRQRHYKNASLQQLLAKDCEACKRGGSERHDVSLLGALAHRYFLCLEFDHCAFGLLKLAAKRRNSQAAHADSPSLNPRSSSKSRADLKKSLLEVGNEFGHATDHISKIEGKMIKEIELIVRHYPDRPPQDELARASVRPLWQYYPELVARTKKSITTSESKQE